MCASVEKVKQILADKLIALAIPYIQYSYRSSFNTIRKANASVGTGEKSQIAITSKSISSADSDLEVPLGEGKVPFMMCGVL